MKLANIESVLLFQLDANGNPLTLEALAAKFGFEPGGTNFYYGLVSANAAILKKTGSALEPAHRAFLDALLASTLAGAEPGKTLVLGLEPKEPPAPYTFVAANLDLVRALATDLATYQQRAIDGGKTLTIVIRYASEMNVPATEQLQGSNAAAYKSTFAQVRQIFRTVAPAILFSFSPAIRADLDESALSAYWPGDTDVDIIGGTWYIGAADQHDLSMAHFTAYVLHRVGADKPFAISELGGKDANNTNNDGVLQQMLELIEGEALQRTSFRYVTLFLEKPKWGADATLAFLRAPAQRTA